MQSHRAMLPMVVVGVGLMSLWSVASSRIAFGRQGGPPAPVVSESWGPVSPIGTSYLGPGGAIRGSEPDPSTPGAVDSTITLFWRNLAGAAPIKLFKNNGRNCNGVMVETFDSCPQVPIQFNGNDPTTGNPVPANTTVVAYWKAMVVTKCKDFSTKQIVNKNNTGWVHDVPPPPPPGMSAPDTGPGDIPQFDVPLTDPMTSVAWDCPGDLVFPNPATPGIPGTPPASNRMFKTLIKCEGRPVAIVEWGFTETVTPGPTPGTFVINWGPAAGRKPKIVIPGDDEWPADLQLINENTR